MLTEQRLPPPLVCHTASFAHEIMLLLSVERDHIPARVCVSNVWGASLIACRGFHVLEYGVVSGQMTGTCSQAYLYPAPRTSTRTPRQGSFQLSESVAEVRMASPPGVHRNHSSVGQCLVDSSTAGNLYRCNPQVHSVEEVSEAEFGQMLVKVTAQHVHLQ